MAVGAVGDQIGYDKNFTPFGSSGGLSGSAQFSTGRTKAQQKKTGTGLTLPDIPGLTGGTGTGGTGTGGSFTAGSYDPLNINVAPSPEMQQATKEYQQRLAGLSDKSNATDQNLQYQIDEYKKRMGDEPTTRSIEQAASAIRDQMAGLGGAAQTAGAQTGRGAGLGAAGIGEAGQRALAGAAANIENARNQQLDALLLGGQSIMSAPGQQALAYESLANQMYGMNPYSTAANLGLAEKNLGLQAYLGQGQLSNDLARIQMQQQMQPWQIYSALLGGL